MPQIIAKKAFGGAEKRLRRLGLGSLWRELKEVVTNFELLVKEVKDANGGAAVRKLIDKRFDAEEGWRSKHTGDVDWTKCTRVGSTRVCLGVEIQFSARSDLMIVDVDHLRKAIVGGRIDVGALVVPSTRLATFLTDRVGGFLDAKRAVQRARASDLPIIVIALEHDGAGPPLEKMKTRQGK